jgi:hypothetical protein
MEAVLKGGESMSSLYDELSEKLRKDPRLTKRGGARYDLGLLLFNARDALRELWDAADIEVTKAKSEGHPPSECLEAAVEQLRPIFGERSKPPVSIRGQE